MPMTLIRRRIAERLVQSQQNAALLSTFNEVDMTAVMELRERTGTVSNKSMASRSVSCLSSRRRSSRR